MDDLIVNVKIWDRIVGALIWDKNKNVASFQFEPKFLRAGLDVSPIVMPLKKSGRDIVYQFLGNRNECFKGLPGLIADSLPDKYGNEIINEWFAAHGLTGEEITPLDRLCYVGSRGMGALEFVPDKDIKELNVSSRLHMEELTALADKIFNDRVNFREKLLQEDKLILDILKIGTSAGGAKPKAIIALNEETKEVRSGQVKAPDGFTYWLLKFDGTEYSEHDQKLKNPKGIGNIEYAYYRMAIDTGIKMMESRLLPERDNFHFMTKRFDRLDDGGKLHVQSLAAMEHWDMDTRHSYEEAFGTMRKLKLEYPQHEDFYRRMVFNVVSRNHDDHTKNHVFLMDKSGKWSLGPAYDLCYSYVPGGQWTNSHQMSLNGKRDDFTYDDLITVGERVGIVAPGETIEKVVDVVSRWKEYAKDCGVREAHLDLINKNLRLLTKRPVLGYEGSPEKKSLVDLEISIVKKDMNYFVLPKINGEPLLMERISASEYKDFQLGKLSKEDIFQKHYPDYSEENIKNGRGR